MNAQKNRRKARRVGLRRPVILVIDDVAASATAVRNRLADRAIVICRAPNDVTFDDLKMANLVLVDLKLDDWPERDRLQTPALRPNDGLALIATLKSNLSNDHNRTPTAFALRSGELKSVSGTLSPNNREHALAKMLDLDWVFQKGPNAKNFEIEVLSLARAVKSLPNPWPTVKESCAALLTLLKLGENSWYQRALNDVEKAKPPQDVYAETTNGMAVIRWLLHDVLPFPTFLLDERYLSARLHIRPPSFRKALVSGDTVANKLKEFAYQGILAGFAGRRWWRAGIEHWLWRETGGQPFDKVALQAVAKKLSPNMTLVDVARPVVELDDQFRPTDTLLDVSDAVQIVPDDWPPAADPGWVAISYAKKHPEIAALVSSKDRERLESMRESGR
jgi:hypothetical protein